jgi:hypothetical protein
MLIPSIPSAQPADDNCPTPDVSMYRLLAVPDQFHNCFVRTIGFVRLEFEGTAIYPHLEDVCRRVLRNGIWLDFFGSDRDALEMDSEFKGGYAVVEGIFNAERRGHFGMFSGSITKIKRVQRWFSQDLTECPDS